jgi:ATP-dependent Clp protease ATP-binding subunit ClpC
MKIPRSSRREFLKQASIAGLGGAAAWSGLGTQNAQGSTPLDCPPWSDYSRFTDRARKVMRLASEAAHRWRTGYLATEHILLGLLMEGGGVAAHVLINFGVDIHDVQLQVETIVGAGPVLVTTGDIPQTPRARNVIEFSKVEANNLKHNYVGTEHILLALLREQQAVAGQVLTNLGLTLADVRDEVLKVLGHGLSGPRRAPTR